jgi:uncharacterized phage protein gp47/JayE
MAIFGLTPAGFNRKRLDDIKSELEAEYRLIFGDNIDVTPQSVFGQIIGIHSVREADLWEQAETIYNAFYPSTAQGVELSNLVPLNGITRQNATKSTVTITCTGTDGTVIPIGSIVSTSDTKVQFVSIAAGTIISGTVDIAFESVDAGAIEAVSGTLTIIDTPIFGWQAANNVNDAAIGQNLETDAELRVRREQSTQALGQNLVDSLFGQILDLDDVTSALVISNGKDITVDGIPPHQFLTVIEGGNIQDIANTIWINTPQGIDSFGALTEIIEDSQGFPQTINYSRPTEINIFFKLTISTDSNFPATGQDDIKAAMVAFGSLNFGISDDVLLSQFYTPINSIPGITSIDLRVGLSASPTGTANIVIGIDEISKYDTTRIELIVS